jgi:hypothetical protein
MSASLNDFHYDDENVEGNVNEIDADNIEDMLIYICYIAECIVLNKQIDISSKGIKFIRSKILDSLINVCNL